VEDHTRRSLQAKSRLWSVIKSIVDFDMIIRGFIRIFSTKQGRALPVSFHSPVMTKWTLMKGVTIKNQQINGSTPVNRTVFFALIIGSLLAMAAPITCAEEPLSSAGLNDSMLYIEGSIEKLQLLEEQALTASGGDREALLFRMDQRSIKLIDKVATLTGDLAALPEDDPDRLMLEKRLRTKVISVDQHLF